MIKRCFDIFFSIAGLILLFPYLVFIAIIVKLDSKGPIIFKQNRVGKNNIDFVLYKYRTMYVTFKKKSNLTLGNNDSRITKAGYYLRKFKLDELPQLFNILKGDMSFVGPRPELRYFVNKYQPNYFEVLKIKPGLTGLASLKYKDEDELLKTAENPEAFYLNTILPNKIELNKLYIKSKSLTLDVKIIIKTIFLFLK
ncbi:sugar transferase [Neotamlana laminarinivorans]|uniref:Sugar transferase n=1 Tax=Neotamlana laminarinivorans TaxID=2883124 RepID=A0A9X1I097_9FLAO|nr:sugar transferase [Tamlana laminarinivorans]MCB4797649.1 sugar transferase [Tamlana laminarinivorans]